MLFADNRGLGVAAYAATLKLTDAVIRGTLGRVVDDRWGFGLVAMDGAQVSAERLIVERNHAGGIYADTFNEQPPALALRDIAVVDTEGQPSDGSGGRGIALHNGAEVTIERALIQNNREVGLFVSQQTDISISDITVRGTRSQRSDAYAGRGLEVNYGAKLAIERLLLDRNRDSGAFVAMAGSALELTDAVIQHTTAAECAELPADDPALCDELVGVNLAGNGLAVIDEASASLERFEIHHSQGTGVLVAFEAEIEGSVGRVYDNAVGAHVRVKGYDLSQLFGDTVSWYDNDEELSTNELTPTMFKALGSRGLRGN